LFDDHFLLAVSAEDPLPEQSARDANARRLILLEEGHCLRDQALAYCERHGDAETGLGATSLATMMQLMASGYGVTLVPEVAVDVEVRNERIKLFAVRRTAAQAQHRSGVASYLAAQGGFLRARPRHCRCPRW
jgi:LysR family transcriptional regulator, hydrogen peroxide-inducible genes activator